MTDTAAEEKLISEAEVENLWEAFNLFDADGSGAISKEELGAVMRSLGQSPSDAELEDMIREVDVDQSGTIDFDEFKTLMVSVHGDRKSRLQLAFSVFDEDGNGYITTSELHSVMSQFGLTDEELDEMVKEVDQDGDGSIDFDEFTKLVPEAAENTGYKDNLVHIAKHKKTDPSGTASVKKDSTAAKAKTAPKAASPAENASADTIEVTRLKEMLAQHPQDKKMRGTSRLQMQIGLFRLIQGAAYRCFRESFSANHETHLRVKNLPYRITDFVAFVQRAIVLYKGLGVVDLACYPLLDAVVVSVEAEYDRLQDRIKNWDSIERTPQMLAEAQAIADAHRKASSVREKFAAGVEFAITLKKQQFSFRDIVGGVLAINELNRLRQMELHADISTPPEHSESNPQEYLKQWHHVILSDAQENIPGAMMPVAYWYEDFMPKLLAAFSVNSVADIQRYTVPDDADLSAWYEETIASGEFDYYGEDVLKNFPNLDADRQLTIWQAWRLTHHYLNGVQKRRERQEFGRESGALSQYVAFIDAYLDRTDMRDAQMRVSFPYFIGPAVWRFFHTTAEIVSTKPEAAQAELVEAFKDFFKYFATMYPCPYCRHHLNVYVVQNKEVDMYPVEYLLLGRDPQLNDFEVSMDAKLTTVVDGPSLRLFFWKLHNTVSSSIARSEEWYHKDEKAFYTTRYWPSLDSELARSKALKHLSISIDRLQRLYGILKPASRLAGVRATLHKLLEKGDEAGIREACTLAHEYIIELEEAAVAGQFLQETYRFDSEMEDEAPFFTPEEESFARTGVFVEVI